MVKKTPRPVAALYSKYPLKKILTQPINWDGMEPDVMAKILLNAAKEARMLDDTKELVVKIGKIVKSSPEKEKGTIAALNYLKHHVFLTWNPNDFEAQLKIRRRIEELLAKIQPQLTKANQAQDSKQLMQLSHKKSQVLFLAAHPELIEAYDEQTPIKDKPYSSLTLTEAWRDVALKDSNPLVLRSILVAMTSILQHDKGQTIKDQPLMTICEGLSNILKEVRTLDAKIVEKYKLQQSLLKMILALPQASLQNLGVRLSAIVGLQSILPLSKSLQLNRFVEENILLIQPFITAMYEQDLEEKMRTGHPSLRWEGDFGGEPLAFDGIKLTMRIHYKYFLKDDARFQGIKNAIFDAVVQWPDGYYRDILKKEVLATFITEKAMGF